MKRSVFRHVQLLCCNVVNLLNQLLLEQILKFCGLFACTV